MRELHPYDQAELSTPEDLPPDDELEEIRRQLMTIAAMKAARLLRGNPTSSARTGVFRIYRYNGPSIFSEE